MGVLLFLSLSMPPLVLVRDSERLMGTFVMYVDGLCMYTYLVCLYVSRVSGSAMLNHLI